MSDVRERIEPVIPACWEAVFAKYVLLVGGPMNGSILPWPPGVERYVISEEQRGWYAPSEGGHFGVWKEVEDG